MKAKITLGIVFAATLIGGGVLLDIGWTFTGWACVAVSFVTLMGGFTVYLTDEI